MQHTPVDYSRKWYAMTAVAMGILLATIDGSIVNVALPTLERDLQTDFALVQWVVLAYLLTVTILMLSVGRLADMLGKRYLFVSGFIIFTVGSVLCGLAPSIGWLIGFRVLQAIGAAMQTALGAAIITEAFPPQERGKALGISGLMVSIGIVLGPTLGGILIEALSWHWIFFVNLPVGIVGTMLAWWFVPDTRPQGGQRFDFPGAGMFFVSLMSLLTAMTLGQNAGFTQISVLALLGAWITALLLFILIERQTSQPMVDLSLFCNRTFNISLINGLIAFVLISGTLLLMPFYLENVLGYATRDVGLLLATVPITLGISAPISGALSDRFGTRSITIIGQVVLLFGFYALTTLSTQTTATGYIIRFLPIGLGIGIFQSPNNSAIMGAAPNNRLGVASGLLALTRTLGQTVGIALLGALWAGRVAAYSGNDFAADTTTAPPAIQVAALHDTFLVAIGLISLALALSMWNVFQERRTAVRQAESC